jgi:hypothetical protein
VLSSHVGLIAAPLSHFEKSLLVFTQPGAEPDVPQIPVKVWSAAESGCSYPAFVLQLPTRKVLSVHALTVPKGDVATGVVTVTPLYLHQYRRYLRYSAI